MKRFFLFRSLLIMLFFLCTSCACHTYHFGVPGRAAMVPDDFGETEAALDRAANSAGSKYCPDKLDKARQLAHDGAEVYWACHNTESSRLLAEARQLAGESEKCGPQAAPAHAAPACNLKVAPSSITKGESTVLSWSSREAKNCVIEPGIGPVETQGSINITPGEDTVYSLTCSGAGGQVSSEAKVSVVTNLPAAPAKEELCMSMDIEFDTNRAVIKPAYFKEVEKVANFMKKYPQVRGAIEGHTDNVGSAAYNEKLSQRRAESAVKMLVGKYGIDKSRLTAKGYGLTRPIADNGTKEGRQKNRRTVANFGCVKVD